MYKDLDKIHEERDHLLSLHEKLLSKLSKLAGNVRHGEEGGQAACVREDIVEGLTDATAWLNQQSDRLELLKRHGHEGELEEVRACLRSIKETNVKMAEYFPGGSGEFEEELFRQILMEQGNLLLTAEQNIERMLNGYREVVEKIDEMRGINDSIRGRICNIIEQFHK